MILFAGPLVGTENGRLRALLIMSADGEDEIWEGMLAGSVRAAAVIERQPESVRRRIRMELESVVAPYRSDVGITLPVSAKLASGRRS